MTAKLTTNRTEIGLTELEEGSVEKMGGGIEVDQAREMVETEEQYLQRAQEFGREYRCIVDSALGQPVENEFQDERVVNLHQSAQNHFSEQAILAEIYGATSKRLLAGAFPAQAASGLLDNESDYVLETLKPGMYVIVIRNEIYQQLRPGAQALAVKNNSGISFVLLSDLSDRAENLPHETQHLIYNFFRRDGLVITDEEDEELAKAYVQYQDELMARVVSDGYLAGYSHLSLLPPPERQNMSESASAREIISLVRQSNDQLEEIQYMLPRSHITKQDLAMAVMEAQNFFQLQENLECMKHIIESNSTDVVEETKTDETSLRGWGSL